MDAEDSLKRGIRFLFILLWKILLVSIWGTLRLIEVVLSHINGYIKQLIK